MDEADKMLEMHMEQQLRAVVGLVPSAPRQTLLWTATLSIATERLARSSVQNPIEIRAGNVNMPVASISHDVYYMQHLNRDVCMFHCYELLTFS